MKKYEKHLQRMLQNADMETVEQIAAQFPAADDAAKERIYQGILEKQRIQPCSFTEEPEHVPSITRRHCRSIWAAAACLLICGGIVGGAAMHRPMPAQQETEATAAASGPTEGETQVRAETPETQTAPAAAVSTEAAEHVTEVPAETRTETAVVTVAAEEIVQTAMSEAAEPSETAVQETTFIPAVSETQPTETWTETMQTDVQETMQTDVQEIFAFSPDAVIPGFTLSHEEGVCRRFLPEEGEVFRQEVEVRYAPAHLPEGVTLDEEEERITNQNYESCKAAGLKTYSYEHQYFPPSAEDGTFLYSSFYILTDQEVITEKHGGRTLLAENTEFTAVMIGSYRGMIAKEVLAEDAIQYTIFWVQDGYLFSVETSNIPESYLPELIRMAESVQPIE